MLRFYLLHNFGNAGWAVGNLVLGDLDHGAGTDGPDLYLAGGENRTVWDVEYDGGSVTDPASYSYYTMVDTSDTPGDFQPRKLAIGGDMDGDGNKDLVVQSVNHPSSVPSMYVVEWGIATKVDRETEGNLPRVYELKQNYPNPFNPMTTFSYNLPESGDVSLKIYTALGQEISTLVNKRQLAGTYKVSWDGKNIYGKKVASGVYFSKIMVNNFEKSIKVTLLK